jgi:Ser/Thr protein kinase RdoA (MazF antagonist)
MGAFDVWETAMTRLGRLQVLAANRVRSLSPQAVPPLIRYDQRLFQRWPVRAVQIAASRDRPNALGSQAALKRLAQRYTQVTEFLSALPWTVIHGDCFPSNVLVKDDPGEQRICFVDWEMAGFGPGLIDIASLTAGSWSDLERERLLLAYRGALEAAGQHPPSLDELLYQLAYCRLHLAMQFLGWSSNWLPPSEQEQDWLGEALSLAETLLP